MTKGGSFRRWIASDRAGRPTRPTMVLHHGPSTTVQENGQPLDCLVPITSGRPIASGRRTVRGGSTGDGRLRSVDCADPAVRDGVFIVVGGILLLKATGPRVTCRRLATLREPGTAVRRGRLL